MKRILFLTGTRADFGKLKPLISATEESGQFESHIFATGMHTLSRYGWTFDEIRKCGFQNIFLHINQMTDLNGPMDLVLARTIDGFSHFVHEFTPDLIVVHGDRVEALAGAITGALNNILVAHIEGGELSGTVDELIRHAVSKLAHIHFVANADAKRRLVQMGESESSVFAIGSPDVDVMLSDHLPTIADAKARYEIPFDTYGIVLYHPVTTDLSALRRRAELVVHGLIDSDLNFVVVHPNNDTGASIVMEELRRLGDEPRFRLFPSIRFEHFLTLLKHARVIVGNSSAGVREAPVYGVPSVNIGNRQLNRYAYPSIINVHDEATLAQVLATLPARCEPSLHFGDGRSAERFLNVITQASLWELGVQKQFQDRAIQVADGVPR